MLIFSKSTLILENIVLAGLPDFLNLSGMSRAWIIPSEMAFCKNGSSGEHAEQSWK